MEIESAVRRIMADNQQARGEAQSRTARLLDVLQKSREEFTSTSNDLLNESVGLADQAVQPDAAGDSEKDGSVLGTDGET